MVEILLQAIRESSHVQIRMYAHWNYGGPAGFGSVASQPQGSLMPVSLAQVCVLLVKLIARVAFHLAVVS